MFKHTIQHTLSLTVTDYSNLLPPNMSFYDMALESKESQINWFMKLVETQGFDVAQRFADAIRKVPTMTQSLNVNRIDQALQPMPNVQGYGPPPQDLSFDTVMSNATMSQTLLSDLLGTKDLPLHQQQQKQTQHLSQFQTNSKLHPMSLSSTNRNSVILNELGGYRMNDIPQQHQQQQQPPQQSVPLYRRQAGQSFGSTGSTSSNNQSISSSTPDNTIDNNIFDNLFNHHDTNQFHGILPMHSLTASLQQQNSFHLNLNHSQSGQQQQQQQQHRDDLINRHNNSNTTTYASVLTQGTNQQNQNNMSNLAKQQQQSSNNEEKDPFAAIRELGQRSRSNGYYNYFQ